MRKGKCWQIFWVAVISLMFLTFWFPVVLSPWADGQPPKWMEWVLDQALGNF